MNKQWDIDFITRDQLKAHIKNTIEKFMENTKPLNLKQFNKNIIDPIKLTFDKALNNDSWEDIINKEIVRQKDKANTNDIGYFHQNLFKYITNCEVPPNGQKGGWDIIYRNPNGITIENEIGSKDTVHTIYAEMKNKHNTMNNASANDTYIKMQNQLLSDDDCFCFLIEVIAKHSQNIVWTVTLKNKEKAKHKRIRRVSIDKFYEIITNDKNAFYKLCIHLPELIYEVTTENSNLFEFEQDTVFSELNETLSKTTLIDQNNSYLYALYMLGFSEYNGFDQLLQSNNDDE